MYDYNGYYGDIMKKLLSIILSLFIIISAFAGCGPSEVSNLTGKEIEIPALWYDETPVTMTKAELDEILSMNFTTPKNVIVMISDGMGPNDITIAEKYSEYCFEFGLILNQIKNHGFATTYCANSDITDSAAAGTALATGVKTNLEYVGVDPNGNTLKNITEIARENGKRVGVVTNDSMLGATPSAFTIHALSRDDEKAIANAYMDSLPDVLMGHEFSAFRKALTKENREKLETYAFAKKFYDINETLSQDPKVDLPLIAFSEDPIMKPNSYDLSEMTETALKRLKCQNGFFLMVENTTTDDAGHSNNMMGKISGVVNFDRAIAVVLKFMKENPDTLLIITSDHETGGVQLPKGDEKPDNSLFTSEEHTATNVRVFGVGYGSEYFSGKTIDNTDIAKFAINAVKNSK